MSAGLNNLLHRNVAGTAIIHATAIQPQSPLTLWPAPISPVITIAHCHIHRRTSHKSEAPGITLQTQPQSPSNRGQANVFHYPTAHTTAIPHQTPRHQPSNPTWNSLVVPQKGRWIKSYISKKRHKKSPSFSSIPFLRIHSASSLSFPGVRVPNKDVCYWSGIRRREEISSARSVIRPQPAKAEWVWKKRNGCR